MLLKPELNLHAYLNEFMIYGDLSDSDIIKVYYEILKRCDGSKTKKDIYYEIAKIYDFDIQERNCKNAFDQIIQVFRQNYFLNLTERLKMYIIHQVN